MNVPNQIALMLTDDPDIIINENIIDAVKTISKPLRIIYKEFLVKLDKINEKYYLFNRNYAQEQINDISRLTEYINSKNLGKAANAIDEIIRKKEDGISGYQYLFEQSEMLIKRTKENIEALQTVKNRIENMQDGTQKESIRVFLDNEFKKLSLIPSDNLDNLDPLNYLDHLIFQSDEFIDREQKIYDKWWNLYQNEGKIISRNIVSLQKISGAMREKIAFGLSLSEDQFDKINEWLNNTKDRYIRMVDMIESSESAGEIIGHGQDEQRQKLKERILGK